MHCPARISDYQHDVVIGDRLFPCSKDLLVVIVPMLAEAIHRFVRSAGQMKIAYCEYRHFRMISEYGDLGARRLACLGARASRMQAGRLRSQVTDTMVFSNRQL